MPILTMSSTIKSCGLIFAAYCSCVYCSIDTQKKSGSSNVDEQPFELSYSIISASIGAFLAGAASAGAGLGGGGLMVPLYIIVLKMSPHLAIPLSKATIFGSAVASFLVNIRKHHPIDKERPLIDFETMTMLEPLTLAGTVIGVLLNTMSPVWLITLLLFLLLTKTTLRTYTKAQKIWEEEHQQPDMFTTSAEMTKLLGEDPDQLHLYKNSVPVYEIVLLLLAWCGLFWFSLLKGGSAVKSIIGIECGSLWYWVLVVGSFFFFVLITWAIGTKTVLRHKQLLETNYKYLKGDFVWTKRAALKFPFLCVLAGIAASLLGIGGGMVKNPLMLEMGLLPQVASATSSTMILFTSSATTLQYLVVGALRVDYALWFGGIGFCAGLTGQYAVNYLIRKYRKTSIVLFLLALILGFSDAVMVISQVNTMFYDGIGSFNSVCHVAHA